MESARGRRVVVAAAGDDALARLQARAMLVSGLEVVFVGGDQSVEQVARTVRAEDAGAAVVDADPDALQAVRELLADWGLGDVEVSRGDRPHAPPATEGG